MKTFIRVRIAAGDTEQEIKDALVAEFGPGGARRAAGRWLRPSSRGCSRSRLCGGGSRRRLLVRSWKAPRAAAGAEEPSTRSSSASWTRSLARFDG